MKNAKITSRKFHLFQVINITTNSISDFLQKELKIFNTDQYFNCIKSLQLTDISLWKDAKKI